MGNKNSILAKYDTYNIFFQSCEKTYKSKNDDIKKSNNTNFVYFTVKNISVMELLNKNIKMYISRITLENEVYEDKLDLTLDATPVTNKIKDKIYYDIKLNTKDGKYVTIRYENMMNKQFRVIYID
jgi:hypothetical protein